jgi:hypothetical protein
MKDYRNKSVAQAFSSRRDFLQLVLIGVLLALATSILATVITSKTDWSTATTIGVLLLIVVAVFAIRAVLAARVIHRSFSAALVLSPEDLQPAEAEVYEFSGEIARILKAAFYENKAFADAWRREPVTQHWRFDTERATVSRVQEDAGLKLLNEALETWLSQALSTHLTDYYNQLDESEKHTVKFERENVPSLLLENRILNLLSTPIGDRAAFLETPASTDEKANQRDSENMVYSQSGPGDALFERLELVLPKGSKLTRQRSGTLVIDTPRLYLSLEAKHNGFTANLPHRFVSHFYGLNPFEARSLLIQIELTGRVKPLGMLRGQGWELYHWVDSFADYIEEAASVDALLARIRWPAVEAMLIVSEGRSKKRGPRKASHKRMRLTRRKVSDESR